MSNYKYVILLDRLNINNLIFDFVKWQQQYFDASETKIFYIEDASQFKFKYLFCYFFLYFEFLIAKIFYKDLRSSRLDKLTNINITKVSSSIVKKHLMALENETIIIDLTNTKIIFEEIKGIIFRLNYPNLYEPKSFSIKNIIDSVIEQKDCTTYHIEKIINGKIFSVCGDIPTTFLISKTFLIAASKQIELLKDILNCNDLLKNEFNPTSNRYNFNYNYKLLINYYSYIFKLIYTKIVKSKLGIINYWNVAYFFGNINNMSTNALKKFDKLNNSYIADPFIFEKNGEIYCFVEEFNFKKKKGVISYYILKENAFKYVGVVLEESFHLSFPNVFEHDGTIYLCPESSSNNDIRLYKAVSFPDKWQLEMILMSNVCAADSLIFLHENKWWLLTNINKGKYGNNCCELSIFYSDSLRSNNWYSHKLNPITRSSLKARNGGIIKDGNILYRVNQKHSFAFYGKGLEINEIVNLNVNEYEEIVVKTLATDIIEKSNGIHHITHASNIFVIDYSYVN
jgi:hypothetical protein